MTPPTVQAVVHAGSARAVWPLVIELTLAVTLVTPLAVSVAFA